MQTKRNNLLSPHCVVTARNLGIMMLWPLENRIIEFYFKSVAVRYIRGDFKVFLKNVYFR